MPPNLHRLLALFLSFLPITATAAQPKPTWHLLMGAGSSHIGWGATYEHVTTRDLILRREIAENRLRGKGLYQSRRSILIEVPLHILVKPHEPPMLGLTVNSSWTFNLNGQIQPYLFAGGGGLYTQAQIPGTSSEIKGVYQAGAGLHFNQGEAQISLEVRYHHLSNGSVRQPNDSLNSTKLLVGIKLPFF